MQHYKTVTKKLLATLTSLVLFYSSVSPALAQNADSQKWIAQNIIKPDFTTDIGCYHYVNKNGTDPKALDLRGNSNGTEYIPTGAFCTSSGCYNANGSPHTGADTDDYYPVWDNPLEVDTICRNADGTPKTDTADNDDPPGAPTDFTASNITSKSLKLTWKTPNESDNVSGFAFERASNPEFSGASFFSLSPPATATTLELGEQPGKTFYFRMRFQNEHGYSIYSAILIVTMAGELVTPKAPEAVTGLSPTSPTISSITLKWDPATDNGSSISRYVVEYKGGSSSNWTEVETEVTSITINGLLSGTNYDFRVTAYNANGAGAVSATTNMATLFNQTDPTTAPPGNICPTEWNPVCGTDNITYTNECSLNNAGTPLNYTGECRNTDDSGNNNSPIDEQTKKTLLDHHKWQERDIKNRRRELSREFKDEDTSNANEKLNAWEAAVTKLKAIVDKPVISWDDNQNFWNINQEEAEPARQKVDEAFAKFWSLRTYNDFEQFRLKDTERQIKDMRNQLKDIKREAKDIDTSTVEQKITTLESNVKKFRERWQKIDKNATNLQDLMNDLQWEADDALNHYIWDDLNELWEISNKSRESQDMERILRDYAKNAKERERRIKELEKDDVEAADLQKFQSVHNRIEEIYKKMENFVTMLKNASNEEKQYIDSRDFWDLLEEYNYTQNEFWDLEQSLGIWDKRELENLSREIKNNMQILEDMKRECGKVQCKEKAKNLLTELAKFIQNMRDAMAIDDFGGAWDAHNDFHFYSRDFWDENEERRIQKDVGIQLKELTRRYDHEKEWTDNMNRHDNRPVVAQLMQMVKELKTIIDDASASYKNGDHLEAQQILQDKLYNNWERRWGDLTYSLNEEDRRGRDLEDISHMRKEFDRFEFNIRNATDEDRDVVDQCITHLEKGRTLVDELEILFGRDNIDEYAKQIDLMWEKLGSLGNRAEKTCGKFMDGFNRNTSVVINDFFDEGAIQERMEKMFNNMANEILNKMVDTMTRQMANIMTTMMEAVGEAFEKQVEATLSAVTQVVPKNLQEAVMTTKQATLEKAKQLEELKSQLGLTTAEQQKLDEAKDRLANADLYGIAAGELEEEISSFIDDATNMSPTARQKRLESILTTIDKKEESSRILMKDDNVIPFYDTGLSQWFTGNVRSVFDEGIVSGKADAEGNFTGYYDPSAPVTVAEFTKIAMETAGKSPQEGTPANIQARNHWARNYVVTAEQLGGEIANFYKNLDDLNRPAQRREVVFLLLAIKGINPSNYNADQFIDVQTTDNYAKFIEAARNIGLTTGDTDAEGNPTGTFRPFNQMNRAEGAAFSDRFLKIEL